MPKDVDIQPGQAFHLPAAQEKNVNTLLKIFSKKEATAALTEMAKVDKSTWENIQSTVSDLRDISALGGVSNIVQSFRETIELQIQRITTPLTNEVNQLIIAALAPIETILTDIFNNLSTFIAANSVGGAIGGIAGSIVGEFLPGGQLWAVIGALIGAGIQQLIDYLTGGITSSPTGISPTGGIYGGPGGFGLMTDEEPFLETRPPRPGEPGYEPLEPEREF